MPSIISSGWWRGLGCDKTRRTDTMTNGDMLRRSVFRFSFPGRLISTIYANIHISVKNPVIRETGFRIESKWAVTLPFSIVLRRMPAFPKTWNIKKQQAIKYGREWYRLNFRARIMQAAAISIRTELSRIITIREFMELINVSILRCPRAKIDKQYQRATRWF